MKNHLNETVTYEDMVKMIEEVKDLESSLTKEWIVINPQGEVFRGEYDVIWKYLAQFHPLLKLSTKMEIKDE